MLQLNNKDTELLRFCAGLREISSDTLEKLFGGTGQLFRLLDALAQECGVTDVQRRCHDCKHWEYKYSGSGMDLGRGSCSRLSYADLEYYKAVAIGPLNPKDAQDLELAETAQVYTLGTFCCSIFRPKEIPDAQS